jgi:hypothetical protein
MRRVWRYSQSFAMQNRGQNKKPKEEGARRQQSKGEKIHTEETARLDTVNETPRRMP